MKARMTSRVTAVPKLESTDESPAKGRRHGTRARAAPKCAARSDTSNTTIGAGAVFTSGRSPIAMGVRLPRPGCDVNTGRRDNQHTTDVWRTAECEVQGGRAT